MSRITTITALALATVGGICVYSNYSKKPNNTEPIQIDAPKSDPEARRAYDLSLIVHPETNLVPPGIHEAELEWAYGSPKKLRKASNSYTSLGPDNLGGRTRAIAFDVRGSDTILAGGVSSGVFKSTDGGVSWTKVSPANQIHNVTTIVQDPRSGSEDTWYYAGGEASGNSASGSGASYLGYGVYKSTDNGDTWSRLSGSNFGNLEEFTWFSDYVQRLAVDPTNGDVYMACLGSIYKSTNGGSSWSAVLQVSAVSINTGWQSDIIITPAGRIYVSFSGTTSSGGNDYDGVWVSETGSSWTQLAGGAISSPTGWNSTNGYGRVVLAYAPSDTSQVYALYWNGTTSNCSGSPAPEAELFKYDNATGNWTDLSANLPDEGGCLNGNDPFACQGGYDLCIAVKPDDTSTVFIGGTNAYRSTDGFTSTSNTTRIGGYAGPSTYSQYTNHHSDIHTLVFDPEDDDLLYTGSDGGIHSADITATTPAWTSWNNDYQTYQYYYVAVAPDAYKMHYIGGCQDNGTVRCLDDDPSQADILSGDGCSVGIAEEDGVYTEFVSTQNGNVYRRLSTLSSGFISATITPSGLSSKSSFVTKFHLDPDNTDYIYYANGDDLVRNTSAKSATTSGWTNMTGTNSSISSDIMSFATTRGPYNASTASLFLGTSSAKLYRLDDPVNAAASASPTEITPTGMSSGSITDIAVNPRNDDTIMVVYSNYGVNSIWWTGNANTASPTWVNIEGNVTLPSVRSCQIVLTTSGCEYYIGTSVGLYSTTSLSGGSTTWSQEGSSTIGYSVITTMDYRPDDNILLIGTHGNGLYLADIGNPVLLDIESSTASSTMLLDAYETKIFKSSGGDVIAIIENEDNFNYGATTVQIDNTGSGGMDFSTNTGSAQEIMEKTIRITPSNTNSSGNVTISMYFTNAELSGWKTATGWNAKNLALIKSPVSISSGTQGNSVEGTSITIDSTYNGDDLEVTCSFSNGFSGVAAGKEGTGGPLPVTFLSFDVQPQGSNALLNWSTANELNNDQFEVYRKLDHTTWELVGSVKGNGTTNGINEYEFLDVSLSYERYTNACYRLKQVDYDGVYEFTKTICLEQSDQQKLDFFISPNPVSDQLSVTINPWLDKTYSVEIYSSTGKLIYSGKLEQNTNNISLSGMKQGSYFAVLQKGGEQMKTFRFLKL